MIAYTKGSVGQFNNRAWLDKIDDVAKIANVEVKFYYAGNSWGFFENTIYYDIVLIGDEERVEFMKKFIEDN